MLVPLIPNYPPPRPPHAPLVVPKFTPLTPEDYMTEFIRFGGEITKSRRIGNGHTAKRKHEHIIKRIR